VCQALGVPPPPDAEGAPISGFGDPLPLEARDRVRLAELEASLSPCSPEPILDVLEAARSELSAGNYSGALLLAEEARSLCSMSRAAWESVQTAEAAIEAARAEGRTEGLREAEEALGEAEEACSSGDYARAAEAASEALELAQRASKPLPIAPITLAVLAVVLAVSALAWISRRRAG